MLDRYMQLQEFTAKLEIADTEYVFLTRRERKEIETLLERLGALDSVGLLNVRV